MRAYATITFSYDIDDPKYEKLTTRAIQESEEKALVSDAAAYLQWANDVAIQVDVAPAD